MLGHISIGPFTEATVPGASSEPARVVDSVGSIAVALAPDSGTRAIEVWPDGDQSRRFFLTNRTVVKVGFDFLLLRTMFPQPTVLEPVSVKLWVWKSSRIGPCGSNKDSDSSDCQCIPDETPAGHVVYRGTILGSGLGSNLVGGVAQKFSCHGFKHAVARFTATVSDHVARVMLNRVFQGPIGAPSANRAREVARTFILGSNSNSQVVNTTIPFLILDDNTITFEFRHNGATTGSIGWELELYDDSPPSGKVYIESIEIAQTATATETTLGTIALPKSFGSAPLVSALSAGTIDYQCMCPDAVNGFIARFYLEAIPSSQTATNFRTTTTETVAASGLQSGPLNPPGAPADSGFDFLRVTLQRSGAADSVAANVKVKTAYPW